MLIETKRKPLIRLHPRPSTEFRLSDDQIHRFHLDKPLQDLIQGTIARHYKNVGAVRVHGLVVSLLIEDTYGQRASRDPFISKPLTHGGEKNKRTGGKHHG